MLLEAASVHNLGSQLLSKFDGLHQMPRLHSYHHFVVQMHTYTVDGIRRGLP